MSSLPHKCHRGIISLCHKVSTTAAAPHTVSVRAYIYRSDRAGWQSSPPNVPAALRVSLRSTVTGGELEVPGELAGREAISPSRLDLARTLPVYVRHVNTWIQCTQC
jgi:hypothetical protein